MSRQRLKRLVIWIVSGLLVTIASVCGAQTVTDPALIVRTVVSGLSQPTAIAFIGANDILVLQKGDGRVRRVMNGVLQPGAASGYDFMYVIDGGSTDGTVEYFRRRGVPVVGQSRCGRGDAFQLAFSNISADAYIFLSPDGNEDPKDLPKFRPVLEGGTDLVIASRMMKGARNEEDSQIFKCRKWANLVFNLAANWRFRRSGPFITNGINGFRAITANAAKRLELDALVSVNYYALIKVFALVVYHQIGRAGKARVLWPIMGWGIQPEGQDGARSNGHSVAECVGRDAAGDSLICRTLVEYYPPRHLEPLGALSLGTIASKA